MNSLKKFGMIAGTGLALAASVVLPFAAHAQTVPTIGTSDIAAVGGPILTALVDSIKYVLVTFGVPLLFLSVMVAVFLMIYHRVRYGTWL